MDRRRTSARVNEPRTAGGVAVLDEVFVPSDFVPSEAIFAEVDVDRSGRISFQEFAAWWGGRQQALATGDENEVLEGARALEGVQSAWEEADADGSGELDVDEFVATLEKATSVSDWKEGRDPATGRSYFYHVATKETRWDRPDASKALQDFLVRTVALSATDQHQSAFVNPLSSRNDVTRSPGEAASEAGHLALQPARTRRMTTSADFILNSRASSVFKQVDLDQSGTVLP